MNNLWVIEESLSVVDTAANPMGQRPFAMNKQFIPRLLGT